ncbi:MAG: hypothetical protein HEQ19_14650 [Gloeotrichia echinulata CP02]|jgi:hypothetical protein
MLNKFKEALFIFKSNAVLFNAIILTFYLPIQILTHGLSYLPTEGVFGIASFLAFIAYIFSLPWMWVIWLILSLIGECAIIYASFQFKQGQTAKYLEAMSAGSRKWINLFFAGLIATILIFLGLICFVIPGIIFLVIYALIPHIIVLESSSIIDCFGRSAKLTVGKRWQIFWVVIIFAIVFFMFGTLSAMLGLSELSDNIFVSVPYSYIVELLRSFFSIFMFLFYWEARQKELHI